METRWLDSISSEQTRGASGQQRTRLTIERKDRKMGLTYEDVKILLDAVDEWKDAPSSDGFSGALLGLMINGEKTKEDRQIEFSKGLEEARRKSKSRQETAVLLKAKLIHLRDSLAIEDINSEIVR